MDDFTITVKQELSEYVDFPPIKQELHQSTVNPSLISSTEVEANNYTADSHEVDDETATKLCCAKTYRNGAIVTDAESRQALKGVLRGEAENVSGDAQKEKPYSCDLCESRFNWQSNLIAHKRIHTGERKYICGTCGKGFGRSNTLNRHLLVHSADKPFKCIQCPFSTSRKSDLTRHLTGTKHHKAKCDNIEIGSQTNTVEEEDSSRAGMVLDNSNAVIETGRKVAGPQAIRIHRLQSKGNILRADNRETVSFSEMGLSETFSPNIQPDMEMEEVDSKCFERIGDFKTVDLPSDATDASCIEVKANRGETLDPCDASEVCSAPIEIDFTDANESKENLVEDAFAVEDPPSDTESVDAEGIASMADKDNTAAQGRRMNALERTQDSGTSYKANQASKIKTEADQVETVHGVWPEPQNNLETPVAECKESVDPMTSFQDCGSSLKDPKVEEDDLRTYECYECKCAFLAPSLLLTQLETHTSDKMYNCPQCSEDNKVMAMKMNMGGKPYSCDFCEKKFSRKHLKVSHMRTHTGEKPYPCDVCEKKFSTQHRKTTHMTTHTGEKSYSCDVCEKQFARQSFKRKHMRIHTGDKPYSCDICEKKFFSSILKANHMTTHTGEKRHSCDFCEKRFATTGFKRKHMRMHTGDKPYSCDVCEKKFSLSSQKVNHMRTHTGEKPFSCDFCEKRFCHSSQKSQHMKVHTGEKPYSCDFCEKKFSQSGHRDSHMRTHTGEKPYSCDVCEKRFSQSAHRDNHMRSHTGEKPYSCDLCGKNFAWNSHRLQHMKAHH